MPGNLAGKLNFLHMKSIAFLFLLVLPIRLMLLGTKAFVKTNATVGTDVVVFVFKCYTKHKDYFSMNIF